MDAKKALNFFPVDVNGKGVGLPYAPADWPEAGDLWNWRVGNRTTVSGYFRDRYLYPPSRLLERPSRKKCKLASRQAVKDFIRSRLPNADADEFLASFSWKIPATKIAAFELTADVKDDLDIDEAGPSVDLPCCKAGNTSCISLAKHEDVSDSSRLLVCNVCCAEPRYCRDCTCILCGLSVSLEHQGYSYIRCDTLVGGAICGHVAHVNCGIRAYLAGTVGGSIGLDAQYYCRRCDSKMDIVPHAQKVFDISQSLTSRESAESVLNVGICLLRGTARYDAKNLLDRFSAARLLVLNGGNQKDVK